MPEIEGDSEEDEGPPRVVFLNGETSLELLEEGETTTTMFAPGVEDELERHDVSVVNTIGPHPLYEGSGDRELSRPSDDIGFLGRLLAFSCSLVVGVAVFAFIPRVPMTINGVAMTFPPSGDAFWVSIGVLALIAAVVVLLPYAPARIMERR